MTHASSTPRRLAALTIACAMAAALGGCATEFPGEPAELDRFEFPVSMALHPDGRFLYVVSANFNLKYRSQDGGTLSVVDLETGEIVTSATKTFASFATDIELNHDASRGYIAVRGDSTITWFGISPDGGSVDCPLGAASESLSACRFSVPAEPTGLAYVRGQRSQALLDEAGNPILDENGDPRSIEREFDMLAVAHLRDGLVSVATIGDAAPSQKPAFSVASAALVDGPSTVTQQDGERFFVTGRAASDIVGFRPAIGVDGRVIGLFVDTILGIPTPFNAIQGRDLLFDEDRSRLYVTNQAPNSLLVFDTSAGDNDAVSGSRNRIIAQIDLPRGPDNMGWAVSDTGERLLYVTSFDEDKVSIIDPENLFIISDFDVGDGPFDLIVDQTHRSQAYVTNFSENSVSVIDLSDPIHPNEIGIIAGPSVKER